METPVLTVAEAADLLKCSKSFVYREAAAGRLPVYRLGTDLRFVRDDLLEWLRAQTGPSRLTAPPIVATATPGPVQVQEQQFYRPELDQETPLQPIGKGSRLTDRERLERQVWVVTAVHRGKTLAAAADLAGLSRRALTGWQANDPQFSRAVQEALTCVKAHRSD